MITTEDTVRQTTAMLLNLYPQNNVIAGVGQLTSFKQLGQQLKPEDPFWKNEANRPDGWFLPTTSLQAALIFEFKNSNQDISDTSIQNEIKNNITIANTVYQKIIGILYNGFQTRVYIKEANQTIHERKDLRNHCLMPTNQYLTINPKHNYAPLTQPTTKKVTKPKQVTRKKEKLTDIKLAQILSDQTKNIKYNIPNKMWYKIINKNNISMKIALDDQKNPIDQEYILQLEKIEDQYRNGSTYESQSKINTITKMLKSTTFNGENTLGLDIISKEEINIHDAILKLVKENTLKPDPKGDVLRSTLYELINKQIKIKLSRNEFYKKLNKYLTPRKNHKGYVYTGLYQTDKQNPWIKPYTHTSGVWNEKTYNSYIKSHPLAKMLMQEMQSQTTKEC